MKSDDKDAQYQDLLAKLTTVYGECEHRQSEDGTTTDVWQGPNDTAVVLLARFSGDRVSETMICYGKTDAEARAAAVAGSYVSDVDANDTSGL